MFTPAVARQKFYQQRETVRNLWAVAYSIESNIQIPASFVMEPTVLLAYVPTALHYKYFEVLDNAAGWENGTTYGRYVSLSWIRS